MLKELALKKRKQVINLDTGMVFDSITEAGAYHDIKSLSSISQVCKGSTIRKKAGGYVWAYY